MSDNAARAGLKTPDMGPIRNQNLLFACGVRSGGKIKCIGVNMVRYDFVVAILNYQKVGNNSLDLIAAHMVKRVAYGILQAAMKVCAERFVGRQFVPILWQHLGKPIFQNPYAIKYGPVQIPYNNVFVSKVNFAHYSEMMRARSVMATRSCSVLSRWRTVTVSAVSPSSVSKSMTTQYGVPISSWRR